MYSFILILTHLGPMFHPFLYPLETSENAFLKFSECIEIENGAKMGQSLQ